MTLEPAPDIFEQQRAATIDRIRRFGYTANVIGTGECFVPGCGCKPEPYPYAYSLGLCELDQPELVVFGLPLAGVNAAMDPVYAAARDGRPLAVGREHRHDVGNGRFLSLLAVPELWVRRDPGRIGGWFDIYGGPMPTFVQICWADRDGAMPWEAECASQVTDLQPILADDALRYPRPPRNTARHKRRR